MKNPKLIKVTMRDGERETHFECRFNDGQKFAAVIVDDILPKEIVASIAFVLQSNVDYNTGRMGP